MLFGGVFSTGGAVIFALIRKKTVRWAKAEDTAIKNINERLDLWLDDTIHIVDQDYVDKLKKIGEWDMANGVFDRAAYEKNKAEAQERGLAALKSILPKAFKKYVSRHYDDVDSFYAKRIDLRLQKHKIAMQEKQF